MNILLVKLELLKSWRNAGIEKVYKYKNRILVCYNNNNYVDIELIYDLDNIFEELRDIATNQNWEPIDKALCVDDLFKSVQEQIVSKSKLFANDRNDITD